MAPRPSHLPHNTERSALQKLISVGPLPSSKLHPAGKRTLTGMIQKGWLKFEGTIYSVTDAGRAAFKAKLTSDS
jgi:hypothetical protein